MIGKGEKRMFRYIDTPNTKILQFVETEDETDVISRDWNSFKRFLSLHYNELLEEERIVTYSKYALDYGPLFGENKAIPLPAGVKFGFSGHVDLVDKPRVILEKVTEWNFHIETMRDLLLLHSIKCAKPNDASLLTIPLLFDDFIVYDNEAGEREALFHGTVGNRQRLRHQSNDLSAELIGYLKLLNMPFFYKAPFDNEDTIENRIKWLNDNLVAERYLQDYLAEHSGPKKSLLNWFQIILKDIFSQDLPVGFCKICGRMKLDENGIIPQAEDRICRLNLNRKRDQYESLIAQKRDVPLDEAKKTMRSMIFRYHYNFSERNLKP